MKTLTQSQKKVYDYLKEAGMGGVPPTVREICVATGLSSTSTVHNHLKTLEKLGYIQRDNGKNRSVVVTGTKTSAQVPILGTVTAGAPILAFEDVQGYIPYDDKSGQELFALSVKGYSMKDAGILDGDYVIVERTATAQNSQIVVAMIEDEATVKRYYKEKDMIKLQPENDDFEPIYSKDVKVLGKVVSVVRYY